MRWLIVTVVLCLTYLGLMGECAYAKSKRKTVGQYYAEAREYYDKGKDKSAAKTLKKLISHYPRFQPAHMLLGQIYYENDQLKKSYRAFKKGSRLLVDKDNGFAWGVANISSYSYKRAIVGFKKVKKKKQAISLCRLLSWCILF